MNRKNCLWIFIFLSVAVLGQLFFSEPPKARADQASSNATSKILPGFFPQEKTRTPGAPTLTPLGIKAEIEEKGFAVVHILFARNSAEVLPESRPDIENIHDLMMEEPSWCLTVAGHTDGTGDPSYNLDLSRRRAASVKQALTELGIGEERLTVDGFGDTKPVADNTTPENRAKNRRVELVKQNCPD